MKIFKDPVSFIKLPYDYKKSLVRESEGAIEIFYIDDVCTDKLRKISAKTGCTIYMILLSVFNILLSKYSGSEDIVIGSPILGRKNIKLEDIMGVFINTIVLRNKLIGHKKYLDFLYEVKEKCVESYENADYQFEKLIEKLQIKFDKGENPIFNVMFNMSNVKDYELIKLKDVTFLKCDFGYNTSKVDLSLIGEELQNNIRLGIEYNKKLFLKDTIQLIIKDYLKIIDIIILEDNLSIDDIKKNMDKNNDKVIDELSEFSFSD